MRLGGDEGRVKAPFYLLLLDLDLERPMENVFGLSDKIIADELNNGLS